MNLIGPKVWVTWPRIPTLFIAHAYKSVKPWKRVVYAPSSVTHSFAGFLTRLRLEENQLHRRIYHTFPWCNLYLEHT